MCVVWISAEYQADHFLHSWIGLGRQWVMCVESRNCLSVQQKNIAHTWQHGLKIANKPIIHHCRLLAGSSDASGPVWCIFFSSPPLSRSHVFLFVCSLLFLKRLLTFYESRKTEKTEKSIFHIIWSAKSQQLLTITCWNDLTIRFLPVKRFLEINSFIS